MALSAKQLLFCAEYVADPNLNATAAYERAGYTATGAAARVNASRLLTNANIKAEIARLMADRKNRLRLQADDVLSELRHLVKSDVRKLYREDGSLKLPSEWDDATAAAVSGCESEERKGAAAIGEDGIRPVDAWVKKVKLWDKPRAIQLAMDHLGLSKQLTLETVLALLDPPVADALRRAIGSIVPGGSGGTSANNGSGVGAEGS